MNTTIALLFWAILLAIIIPFMINKYDIKDDIKHSKTLPIGTAEFRGFLKFLQWLAIGFVILLLIFSTLSLLGFNVGF